MWLFKYTRTFRLYEYSKNLHDVFIIYFCNNKPKQLRSLGGKIKWERPRK